jgi:hypothetical protein
VWDSDGDFVSMLRLLAELDHRSGKPSLRNAPTISWEEFSPGESDLQTVGSWDQIYGRFSFMGASGGWNLWVKWEVFVPVGKK